MKVILNDKSEFNISEDLATDELIKKFIRIMKYMDYAEVSIVKGLVQNLYEMSYDDEYKKIIKELCEEINF